MSDREVGQRIAEAFAATEEEPSMGKCPECGEQRLSPPGAGKQWRFCLACGYYEEIEEEESQ